MPNSKEDKPTNAGSEGDDAGHDDKDGRNWSSLFEGLVAVSTFIGMVVAIVGAVVLGRQLTLMGQSNEMTRESIKSAKKSADDSAKDFKAALAQATRTADASKAQADTAREAQEASTRANQIDQRAWVGVVGIERSKWKVGEAPEVVLAVRNSGKTPALKAKTKAYFVSGPSKEECEGPFRTTDINWDGDNSRSAIQPGGISSTQIIQRRTPVAQQLLDDLRAGRQILCVRAITEYRDIFGEWHTSRYCAYAQPSLDNFIYCSKGNDAN